MEAKTNIRCNYQENWIQTGCWLLYVRKCRLILIFLRALRWWTPARVWNTCAFLITVRYGVWGMRWWWYRVLETLAKRDALIWFKWRYWFFVAIVYWLIFKVYLNITFIVNDLRDKKNRRKIELNSSL